MLMTTGEVLTYKMYGEHYHSLTIVAGDIGDRIRPGQFVNIRCGEERSHILRRPFSVYRVHNRAGWPSTIEIAFDVEGPGTAYLAGLRSHANVDLIGPLGRGFSFPKRPAHCLLVGGGIGAAPLFFLAEALKNAGHRVDMILGARNAGLILNQLDARRLAALCRITTEDGSAGDTGRVTDILPEVMESSGAQVVYACGPHPMLEAVSRIAADRRVPIQVAVEELMGCGYGVCMTCVMPVKVSGDPEDGTVYARSCTEGPVFDGARIAWSGSAEPAEARG